jgi:hypothetical protein
MSPATFSNASQLHVDTQDPYLKGSSDKRGSMSGSEDGNYPPYVDVGKYEEGPDGESSILELTRVG